MINNVSYVFKELKNKKIINKKRMLKASNSVINFKSGIIRNNEIYYNPSLTNVSKDSLRFILLHEEGHKQSFSYMLVLALVFYTISVFYFKNMLPTFLGKLINTILPTIGALVLFFLFKPGIRRDEFNADLYAARRILDNYNLKPSNLMRRSFIEISKIKPKYNLYSKILNKSYWLFTPHPAEIERIENVIKFERGYGKKSRVS